MKEKHELGIWDDAVLGVPDVVVWEQVHVHVELTVVVEVHIGNEYCTMSHLSLPIQYNYLLVYHIW